MKRKKSKIYLLDKIPTVGVVEFPYTYKYLEVGRHGYEIYYGPNHYRRPENRETPTGLGNAVTVWQTTKQYANIDLLEFLKKLGYKLR